MCSSYHSIGGDQVSAYMIIRDENDNPIWWDGQVTVIVSEFVLKPIDPSNRVHERGSKGSGKGNIVSYIVPSGKKFQFQGVIVTGDTGVVLVQENDVTVFSLVNSAQTPQFGFTYPDNNPSEYSEGETIVLYKDTTNGTIYGEIIGFLEDI